MNNKEVIKQLSNQITQLEVEIVKAYDEGYSVGLAKGEKISNHSHKYMMALDSIRRFIRLEGYFYATGEPSNKGIKSNDIIVINSMACRALGLEND